MNTADLHALTGAYAVDALDEEERAAFEAHLARCEECQQEVAELRAAAARLSTVVEEQPPAPLKADVMAAIRDTRQEPPAPRQSAGPAAAPRPWHDRLLLPAAAVLAIFVVGLSVLVGNLNSRLNDLERSSVAVADVVAAPDLQTWQVEAPGGASARVVYSPTRGEGLFLASGMGPAPEGSVYELWLIDDAGPAPAGLFNAEADGRVAHPITGSLGDVAAIAVTVEPAGGSPEPTSDPIMVVEL